MITKNNMYQDKSTIIKKLEEIKQLANAIYKLSNDSTNKKEDRCQK